MTKLYACYNVFNEAELLPKVIPRALEFFDKLIIADGAYINRWAKPHSTDGTLDYLYSAVTEYGEDKIELIEIEGFWASEVHKRNWMLSKVPYGDWHFYCDGEWFSQSHNEAKDRLLENKDPYVSAIVYVMRAWNPTKFDTEGVPIPDIFTYPYFACFRNQRGLHYCYNHCSLHDENGTLVSKRDDWKVIDPRIGFEELPRSDYIDRQRIKRKNFHKGAISELSDGNGYLICENCGYGRLSLHPDGRTKGFNIPRGMPYLCPRCGSGNVVNAIHYNK